MAVQAFIPKEHHDMPDCYGVKIFFHSNKSPWEGDVVRHNFCPDIGMLEVTTQDDYHYLFDTEDIWKMAFDKRWSKIVEIKRRVELSGNNGASDDVDPS